MKILSENDRSSSSSTTTSGPNSTQNGLNLAHLSQKNYIQELQKEKVFSSLGILILNFSQVLSSIKNGQKRRKRIRNDVETEEGTEEIKEENEDDNGDGGGESGAEGEEGEGDGEEDRGGDNEDGDDPSDLLPTVDLIISILAHVVASEVRY